MNENHKTTQFCLNDFLFHTNVFTIEALQVCHFKTSTLNIQQLFHFEVEQHVLLTSDRIGSDSDFDH